MSKFEQREPESFELKKRRYFSNFALKHLSAFRLHKEQGLLPKTEGWSNVSEHCLLEAVAVDVVSEKLNLGQKERDRLVEAALLHDYFKRREIETMKARGETGLDIIKEVEVQSESVLISKGVDPEVVRMTGLVGAGSLEYFENNDTKLDEKILHYVDDITDNIQILPLRDRVEKVAKKYPDLDKTGSYKKQLSISESIQQELALRLGVIEPEKLPEYIVQQIEERVRNYLA